MYDICYNICFKYNILLYYFLYIKNILITIYSVVLRELKENKTRKLIKVYSYVFFALYEIENLTFKHNICDFYINEQETKT